MNARLPLLVSALVAFLAGSAFAQPDGTTEPAPADSATTAPAAQAATPVSSADESIYVVQRRAYSKSGRFEFTPSFFTSLNNKFVGHLGLGLSGAYHLRENFALEVTTSVPYLYNRFFSGLVYEVRDLKLTPEEVDLKQMTYFAALSLQYSALYGKLDLYGRLIDYDFYVSAGTGFVSTIEVCYPEDANCSDPVIEGLGQRTPDDSDRYKISGNLGGGLRIFFSDRLGLRAEVRDIVYADRTVAQNKVSTDIRNNVILFFGLSTLL
jgi:outer membrane beta-barrel protein